MRARPCILIVDDLADNRAILHERLSAQGYETVQACDGDEALAAVRARCPDLILLDVMMPKVNGLEVCRQLAADPSLPFIPIILLTAKSDSKDVVAGLDAGAHEYLAKPIDHSALTARVRALLRTKTLHDKVEEQRAELDAWNRGLRGFLSPQIADAIARGDDTILSPHRRDVTVVYGDLRGFTAFAESGEPEDVMRVLNEYHAALGPLVQEHEGTIERFMGDGFLVLFNDPLPCPNPGERAVRMAVAMRERMRVLAAAWLRRGFDIGFSVGIAQGFATMGRIGFEGRHEYSAVGSVPNLGARLCDEAKPWHIVVSQRLLQEVEQIATLEPLGDLTLKGLSRPVAAYNVVRLRDEAPG